jgi:hypothetical protein
MRPPAVGGSHPALASVRIAIVFAISISSMGFDGAEGRAPTEESSRRKPGNISNIVS